MRKLILILILITTTAIAQPIDEEPEPVFGNAEYSYEAEIAWGSKTNLVWELVPVTSTLISSQEVPDHFYGIIVIGFSRQVFWQGYTPNSTPTSPESITIGIEMPPLPGGAWWGFFRARFRPFSIIDPTGWSETSYWLVIIDLSAMPIIGPFSALTGGE